MQDRAAEARPPVQPAEKPADPKLAGKAWRELRDRAQKLGNRIKIGWHEIRTGKVDDWLKDADPAKKQEAGFLRHEDPGKGVTKWEDNKETREYLANAQKRAVELAEKGMGEISADLGIPADQIAGKTLQEVYDAAKAKGWNVAEGDPKGVETRDYLRNAYEFAREQQQAVEARVEAEDQAAEFHAAVDAAATAGIIAAEVPGMDRIMFRVIKDKGKITGVIEEEGNALIASKEPEKVALGLDLQIDGLQYQLVLTHNAIQKAIQKKDSKGMMKFSKDARGFDAKIKDLQNQRATGRVKVGDSEVEFQNLKDQPNQVEMFVQKLGVKAENVKVAFFGESGDPQTVEVTSSLMALHNTLSRAIADGDFRKAFIAYLRDNSRLGEDNIRHLEKYLGDEAFKKKVEKSGNLAIKTGAGVGLLMAFMMWLASRKGQGQMG